MELFTEGASSMAGSGKGVQITVTLSPVAFEELGTIAEWKGIALGLHLRQVLEAHHENPGTQKLIGKAKQELVDKKRK